MPRPRLFPFVASAPLILLAAFAACGDDPDAGLLTPPGVGGGGGGATSSSGIGGAFQGSSSSTTTGVGGQGQATYGWERTYGGDAAIFVQDCDVDATGNIVVAGSFTSGAADFGGTPLSNAGGADVFVAKMDPSGDPLWSIGGGDADTQGIDGVATDGDGNVWVTGGFKGTLSFGGGTLDASGNLFEDVFLAKLDGNGGHLFSARFGGDLETDVSNAIATGPSGEVVITGSFQNAIDFGGGNLADAGDSDLFVARFDSTGTHTFSTRFGDAARQEGFAVAVDPSGVFAVGGVSFGAVDFGDGTIDNPGGLERGVVAVFNEAGTVRFGTMLDGAGTSQVTALAFGPGGDLWVAGMFKDGIDFGEVILQAAGANDDLFVARFTSSGELEFAERYGSSASERTTGVAVGADGYATLAGWFKGTWEVNGTTTLESNATVNDAFLAQVGPPGNPYWGIQTQADLNAQGRGVALTPSGDVIFVGEYEGSVDLGSGTATPSTATKNLFIGSYTP